MPETSPGGAVGGLREAGEDVVGIGKGFAQGIWETAGAGKSCMTDFSGCRENVGGFLSAFKEDPFGTASSLIETTVNDTLTKIRQGDVGEAIGGMIGFRKFKFLRRAGDVPTTSIRRVGSVKVSSPATGTQRIFDEP